MGKLLCDSTSVAEPFQGSPPAALPWREPKPEPIGTVDLVVPANVGGAPFAGGGWEDVVGLEEQQRRHLQRLHAKGVLWKPPPEEEDSSSPLSSSALRSVVFRLSHGGEVSADGNCLFTASRKAMGGEDVDARELRRRTVARFLEDLGSVSFEEREAIDNAIRHMYSPDLKNGWGIHVVQEVKLLAKKEDRFALDSAIEELVHLGMQREMAAESIYKERCVSMRIERVVLQLSVMILQLNALLQSSSERYMWCKHMVQMPWSMKKIVFSSFHIVQGAELLNLHFSFS
uniref:OTU domain-containing protein n=1 Tax=Glycine max TaxID=3847 RepID=K7MVA1_SOYBN